MKEKITGRQLAEAPIKVVRAYMNAALKSGSARYFFNNFQFIFNHYRDLSNEIGMMDKKYSEIGKSTQQGHSTTFLNQTPREFFAQVDSVASSFGYTPEEARQIADEKQDRFYKKMAPQVFMKLIEMGYSYLDLIK